MTDVRTQVSVPFALESLWAITPDAFERLRELMSSPERLAAAVAHPAANTSADTLYENSSGVAVIPFTGVVAKRPTIWSRFFGGKAVTTDARAAIGAALADPAVKSILMIIDSPGGTVDGVGDLADTVAVANTVKPVTAYIEDTGASAAYWVASQAGRLVGNPSATVGSIGVFSTVPDISRLAKNMGIEVNVVKSVNGKAAGTPGTPVTDSQLAEVQRLVDATHQLFVSAVSRGRGKDMSSVADGRVHIGQDAVDLGLLDAIEPLSTTLAGMQEAAKPKPTITVEERTMADSTPTPAPDYSKDFAELRAENAKLAASFGEHKASLEAMKTVGEIEATISQARADRKLTPALEKTARIVAKTGGLVGLKEFIAEQPVSAPTGGSVTETTTSKVDSGGDSLPTPRHPSDHVGVALHAFDQKMSPFHQLAVAYMEKANAAGKKVSYYNAVVAVTRKTA